MTIVALTLQEAADRLGVARRSLRGYETFPEPDFRIGKVSGWLPQTIDEWNAERPGQGARTDLVH